MAKRITHLPNATSPTETDYLGMDNTSNGARKILVSALAEYILNHAEISDIGDVSLSNLTNGQVIKWNATTEKWENADESGGGGGSGNVDDVYVNGVSVLDSQHIAQIKSYKEVTQAEYDALPSSKLTDGIMYCITDSDFSASDVPYDNTDSGLSSDNTQGAIDELASNLLIQKSIENTDIATFTDGSNLPMPKLQVGIEPQQDLHGYDSPWVGGAGKNKLLLTVDRIKSDNTSGSWSDNTYSINGAEYKINTDNAGNVISISARNLASNPNGDLRLVFTLSSGSYILSSGFTETNGTNDSYLQKNGVTIARGNNSSPGPNFTLDSSSEVVYHLRLSKSGDSSYIAYPMIRLASVADSTFAPYSNICPISGWSEANVSVCGKNLVGLITQGGWQANGQPTSALDRCRTEGYLYLKQGTYSISGWTTQQGKTIQCGYGLWESNTMDGSNVRTYDSGWKNVSQEMTLTEDTFVTISFRYSDNSNISLSDVTFQLEIGSGTTYEPYNGSTYTIDLGSTRYGGTLAVVSGVLTVDRAYVDLGTLDYSFSSSISVFYSTITNMKAPSTSADRKNGIISSMFPVSNSTSISASIDDKSMLRDAGAIYIRDTDYNDATVFKTAMNGVQLVYELATPTTIQLTPTQVKSLLGSNNVWCDTGKILKLEYLANATDVIASLDARITALENA